MNTEEHNKLLYKELIETSKHLRDLKYKQEEDRKNTIKQFRIDNPDFTDSPEEWIAPFIM